ncbi:hypothetical protein N8T08_011111 [Aspergillus melleus]|uniref:Uncharacterized protein n=1 Tax=Aspergillus melleus TaxID=138277 RepID=A0ACC3AR15_9EURO|nr:hypothetical protein N8T08_011111 [Aspergillus melleus]
MDRVSRLCLLFDQDEALLQANTGLRVVPQDHGTEKAPSGQTGILVEEHLEKASPEKTTQETPDNPDQASESTASSEQSSSSPDPPEHDGSFCPLLAISRYPYRFLKDKLSQSVASRFFDRGQFWSRSWDVYYCHLPPRLGSKYLLLVPAYQFRKLIREINCEFKCQLSLPPNQGLLLPFREKNWFPQPVFLGKCDSQQIRDGLQAKVRPPVIHDQSIPELDEQYLEYETILEAAWEATRNKKSRSKMQQRVQHQQQLVQYYERIQTYLGWRSHESESRPDVLDAASWADKANLQNVVPSATAWEMTQPMPYPFWKNSVLISVDVECNERCHSQVTEVGITTLDLSRLSGVPPGQQGAQWTTQIQSRHLRVREFGHIVNHKFVAGCPANFDFGTSEWVSLADLAAVVQAELTAKDEAGEPRAVVVVGHNPSMDLAYLREMGVPVEVKSNGVVDIVDTAETWRIMRGETSPRSLGAILVELGMDGWHLHNAGNDARYTMEVLIRMMLDHFQEVGKVMGITA